MCHLKTSVAGALELQHPRLDLGLAEAYGILATTSLDVVHQSRPRRSKRRSSTIVTDVVLPLGAPIVDLDLEFEKLWLRPTSGKDRC